MACHECMAIKVSVQANKFCHWLFVSKPIEQNSPRIRWFRQKLNGSNTNNDDLKNMYYFKIISE